MRVLEVCLLIITFINLLILDKRKWNTILMFLMLGLFFAHLFFEGIRWQLYGSYLVIVITFIYNVLRSINLKSNNKGPRSLFIISYIILPLSILLSLLFPVFNLPEPTGSYFVGTNSFEIVDTNRKEIIGNGKYRKIAVKMWYPSDSEILIPVKYWENKNISQIFSKNMGLPNVLFSHINLVDSNSLKDVPVSNKRDKFPVLLFSPMYMGFPANYQYLMEDLASHGYIIFKISHPYEELASLFPNGEIIERSEDILNNVINYNTENFEYLREILSEEDLLLKEKNINDYISRSPVFTKSLQTWSEDTEVVISHLFNNETFKSENKLDLNNIGIFGHSLGGATAAEICIRDKRIKAGINFDGLVSGKILNSELNTPFMTIYSDQNKNMNDFIYRNFVSDHYIYILKDSFHNDFTDNSLISPVLRLLNMYGNLNPYRRMELIRMYTLTFFDKYLYDKAENILDRTNREIISRM